MGRPQELQPTTPTTGGRPRARQHLRQPRPRRRRRSRSQPPASCLPVWPCWGPSCSTRPRPSCRPGRRRRRLQHRRRRRCPQFRRRPRQPLPRQRQPWTRPGSPSRAWPNGRRWTRRTGVRALGRLSAMLLTKKGRGGEGGGGRWRRRACGLRARRVAGGLRGGASLSGAAWGGREGCMRVGEREKGSGSGREGERRRRSSRAVARPPPGRSSRHAGRNMELRESRPPGYTPQPARTAPRRQHAVPHPHPLSPHPSLLLSFSRSGPCLLPRSTSRPALGSPLTTLRLTGALSPSPTRRLKPARRQVQPGEIVAPVVEQGGKEFSQSPVPSTSPVPAVRGWSRSR